MNRIGFALSPSLQGRLLNSRVHWLPTTLPTAEQFNENLSLRLDRRLNADHATRREIYKIDESRDAVVRKIFIEMRYGTETVAPLYGTHCIMSHAKSETSSYLQLYSHVWYVTYSSQYTLLPVSWSLWEIVRVHCGVYNRRPFLLILDPSAFYDA